MFGNLFAGEVLDQLDDLEALPRREPEKCSQQSQALDGVARRRPEFQVQFSRKIEVFHLAPMKRTAFV